MQSGYLLPYRSGRHG